MNCTRHFRMFPDLDCAIMVDVPAVRDGSPGGALVYILPWESSPIGRRYCAETLWGTSASYTEAQYTRGYCEDDRSPIEDGIPYALKAWLKWDGEAHWYIASAEGPLNLGRLETHRLSRAMMAAYDYGAELLWPLLTERMQSLTMLREEVPR